MKTRIVLLIAVALFFSANVHAQCQAVNASLLATGQLDWGAMSTQDDGSGVWTYNSSFGAKGSKQGGHTGYLLTPAYDFAGAQSVTVSFQHTHRYAGSPETEYKLYVTDNFQGSFGSSSWTELPIYPYATNNDWTFVSVTIDVPLPLVGSNTVFAFEYISTATTYGTWEIKNLEIESTCPSITPPGPTPTDSPVPLPAIGNGRLKVCAQNLRNYYYNYSDNDRPDYSDHAGFARKTRLIVDAMMWANADIYAFCEVEAMPIVLRQLADSMNARVEGSPYAAVSDFIEVPSSVRTNNIKSGFIYRTDKVQTYGNNNAGSTSVYYRETMRIQVFKEIASGGCFTVSMNHFKAKDSSADEGNNTRVNNANSLLSALQSYAADPDILILGDLNCEVGEQPITILENAGYSEQLLRFDNNAYSHCWNGGELIDHVMANSSMAAQITGAGVFHICTSCSEWASYNYEHRYSDHDPYLIAIELSEAPSALKNTNESTAVRKVLDNGRLIIILPDGSRYLATGQKVQ